MWPVKFKVPICGRSADSWDPEEYVVAYGDMELRENGEVWYLSTGAHSSHFKYACWRAVGGILDFSMWVSHPNIRDVSKPAAEAYAKAIAGLILEEA